MPKTMVLVNAAYTWRGLFLHVDFSLPSGEYFRNL